ncbi:MAG: hypothetical protein IT536_05685 [Hyphomicrobiales bacterium]|nr:hypothetical protein [Hyphomicrobiales bacterium]
MDRDERISPSYLALQRELHRNPDYGVASLSVASLIKQIIVQSGIKSVCDYGAGKCNLKLGLQREGLIDFTYLPYDPAFPEYGKPQLGCRSGLLHRRSGAHRNRIP